MCTMYFYAYISSKETVVNPLAAYVMCVSNTELGSQISSWCTCCENFSIGMGKGGDR